GWLGISVEDVSWDRAKSLGMAAPKGAYVAEVMKGSPAQAGGLAKGDVILSYNGIEVADASRLRNMVAVTPVGKEAKITVLRAQKNQDLAVKIGNQADAVKAYASSTQQLLGAEFRSVTTQEEEKYGLNPKQGVAVTQLDPKGPLGRAGFEKNDLILEINGQAVDSLESFLELASTLRPHAKITLLALDHNSGQSGRINVTIQ
ncbi:MAG TPA: PDZ domain-containing protein, partial [Syntrophorhabdaceae bacterium]